MYVWFLPADQEWAGVGSLAERNHQLSRSAACTPGIWQRRSINWLVSSPELGPVLVAEGESPTLK